MAEVTSGVLTVIVLDAEESDALVQHILDNLAQFHADPVLESIALDLGAI